MKTKYIARGLVFGNYWGGGRGAYASETIKAPTIKKIFKTAKEMLKTGALDSGMGYESLIGAALGIEKITTIEKDRKEYSKSEYNIELIGDLNESEQDFLINNLN